MSLFRGVLTIGSIAYHHPPCLRPTGVSLLHAPVASLLDQLGSELPEILSALDTVDARLLSSSADPSSTSSSSAAMVLPESVLLAAVSDPSLVTDDPALAAAAASRGALLIEELAGLVKRLGPRVEEMLGLGTSLQVGGVGGKCG